jgi:hypothetical protein
MSGMNEEIELENCLSANSNVFAVKITGFFSVKIKELANAAVKENDPSLAEKYYYSAVITEVINKSSWNGDNAEPWTMKFSKKEKQITDKITKDGINSLGIGDTIFIMDSEDIEYTIIY